MTRFRLAGGLDLATGALILSGAGLIAASIVVAVVLVAPPAPPSTDQEASGDTSATRRLDALPADRVATVITVDVNYGASSAARAGDRVDVLEYFSRQITGADALTRVLLRDVPVVGVDRSGPNVSLTLAVPPASALLLHEAQVLGGKPFVTLSSPQGASSLPDRFSDTDLAARIGTGAR